MESLGFVLMTFLRGSLPWQGLKANTKKQKYQRILERKQASHPEILCRGYPNEFLEYFTHCSSMSFEDRPDYRYLKRIMKELFKKQGYEDDGLYDWDASKKQEGETGVGGGHRRTRWQRRREDEYEQQQQRQQEVHHLEHPTVALRVQAKGEHGLVDLHHRLLPLLVTILYFESYQ